MIIPDLSHYVYVKDWAQIKANCPFLISKATQGTAFIDKTLDDFIEGCEKNHIPYWVYNFLNKGNELAQTKFLVKTVSPKVGNYFCGYALDFERQNSEADIIECIEYLNKLGKVLVYGKCALSAVKKKRSDTVAYWYARYGVNNGKYNASAPIKPAYIDYVDLHQFTSKGTIPGANKTGDLNRLTGKRDLSWFTDCPATRSSETVTTSTTTTTKKETFTMELATLRNGSTGNQVNGLQAALKGYGFYTGKIDGLFKDKTEEAVTQYQHSVGIREDGIAGPQTYKHLFGIN